jgi:hypothetical protein
MTRNAVIRAAAVPTLNRRVDEALAAFADSGHFCCSHILYGAFPVQLCAQRPRIGLLCWACTDAHRVRHNGEEEFRCDECLEITETISPAAVGVDGSGQVGTPGEEWGYVRGAIAVVGLGLCPRCGEAAVRTS